jgi:hypothetical protein
MTARDDGTSGRASRRNAAAPRAAVAGARETPPAPGTMIAFPRPLRLVHWTVRRDVWRRDGGRCTFESEDGNRCESTSQLELEPLGAAAVTGVATADDLRLRCRTHNGHRAQLEHLTQLRRRAGIPPTRSEQLVMVLRQLETAVEEWIAASARSRTQSGRGTSNGRDRDAVPPPVPERVNSGPAKILVLPARRREQ